MVEFLLEKDRDQIGLFLEKRLGKCILSTLWAISTGAMRILVVAPLSAIPDWTSELTDDGQYFVNATITADFESYLRLRDTQIKPEFVLINPQGLFTPGKGSHPRPKPIALLEWDAVIWDEATNLRNPRSQITKIAHACFGDVKYRAILSGEYAPEGAEDIFEPMNWCFGSFMNFRKFWPWRDAYFTELGYDWTPKMGSMKKIKAAVMEKCYILSRRDANVGEKSIKDRIYVDLPKKFRHIYDHCEKYYEIPADDESGMGGVDPPGPLGDLGPHTVRYTKYAPVVATWLAQLAGGYPKNFRLLRSSHKMQALTGLVRRTSGPIVVSFAYNAELFEAKRRFDLAGISCVAVWGSMLKKERPAAVKSFQKGGVRVILKQARIHFGMNLSRASIMIRYSIPRAYLDISQDRDRIVDPSKKEGIVLRYIDLITRDTIDEDIVLAASEKRTTARYFAENLEARFELRRTGNLEKD